VKGKLEPLQIFNVVRSRIAVPVPGHVFASEPTTSD